MINKPSLLILTAAFFLVSAGLAYYATGPDNLPATLNVRIEKADNGIWRVRDVNGRNRGTLRVAGNDRINWQAKGSAVEFRFHKNVAAYFNYADGLFGDGRTQRVSNNGVLGVTIKESAPKDSLVYDVYVYSDSTYVVGNSPPVMIIR